MMSNVKKKDVPLISISLVAILFIAAALSPVSYTHLDVYKRQVHTIDGCCHTFTTDGDFRTLRRERQRNSLISGAIVT